MNVQSSLHVEKLTITALRKLSPNRDIRQVCNLFHGFLDNKISVELLFDRPSALLDRIQFEVSFQTTRFSFLPPQICSCQSDFTTPPSPPTTFSKLSDDLANQFGDVKTSDVTFTVGDTIFPAHKWILQARLLYFRSMFSSQMLETATNQVKIDDTDPDSFRRMLMFLYSGRLPRYSPGVASSLLPLADKYGVEDLRDSCAASKR